jgi:hypothetical protein
MIQSGARRGLSAKRLTQAALLCEAKLDEIVAGVQPLQPVSQQPLEGANGWVYSVAIESQAAGTMAGNTMGSGGLSLVHVTVAWVGTRATEQVEYSLSRLVIDPRMRVPAPSPTPTAGS